MYRGAGEVGLVYQVRRHWMLCAGAELRGPLAFLGCPFSRRAIGRSSRNVPAARRGGHGLDGQNNSPLASAEQLFSVLDKCISFSAQPQYLKLPNVNASEIRGRV
jgi:hypothetical protein